MTQLKAAVLVVALALVLYVRDARVLHTARLHSAQDAASRFTDAGGAGAGEGSDPFHTADEDLFGSEDHDDDDDFGTDREHRQKAQKRAGAKAAAEGAGGEFDEFNFHMDYSDEDEEDPLRDDDFDDFDESQYSQGANSGSHHHRLLIQFDDAQYTTQFESVQESLQRMFPALRNNVRGEKYPVPALTQTISTLMSMAPLFLMGLVFLGDRLFPMLGLSPELLEKVKANRMYALPLFLVFNMFVRPRIMQTNAFEVVYNGAVVFSKLRTGVLPVGADLTQLVAALKAAGLQLHNSFADAAAV